MIDDFIIYINENNIPLSGYISKSFFDTNEVFGSIYYYRYPETSIIEYASFFGSMRIIQYLHINKIKLEKSLWTYSSYSDSAEMISFLIENDVKPFDETSSDKNYDNVFNLLVECSHNQIANYILENYAQNIDISDIRTSILYNNYEFFPSNFKNIDSIFILLCTSDNISLVKLFTKEFKPSLHQDKNHKSPFSVAAN